MSKIPFSSYGLQKAPKFNLILDGHDVWELQTLFAEACENIERHADSNVSEVKIVVEIDSYAIAIETKNNQTVTGLVIEEINHLGDMGITE